MNQKLHNQHQKQRQEEEEEEDTIIPVLIIGAGPHALALMLNLMEEESFDEFTEAESIRMNFWRKKLSANHSYRSSKVKNIGCRLARRKEFLSSQVRVVDPSGKWMSTWNASFDLFGIEYLRSPVNVHLDPLRPQGLRDYATLNHRLKKDVKEPSKSIPFGKSHREFTQHTPMFSETERQFFGCPSQSLFKDFHQYLIDFYHLQEIVEKKSVVSIQVEEEKSIFLVKCSNGEHIRAKKVVAAIGTQNIPRIPSWVPQELRDANASHRIVHSCELIHDIDLTRQLYKQKKHVLIVGGGLTSIYLAKEFLSWGVHHVTLVTRKSKLRLQPFDVPLDWLSPTLRLKKLAEFYEMKSSMDKIACIQKARQGGSITHTAFHLLQQVLETCPNQFSLVEKTQVLHATLSTNLEVILSNGDQILDLDGIVLATGSEMDISKEKMFHSIQNQMEIECGLPQVDEELRPIKGLDLFLMGGYAALALGPTAGNLMGAKTAANRLRELLIDEEKINKKHNPLRVLSRKDNLYQFLDSESDSEVETDTTSSSVTTTSDEDDDN